MSFPCKLTWEGQTVELWHLGARSGVVELQAVPAGRVSIAAPHSMIAPMFVWRPFTIDVTPARTTSVNVPLRIPDDRGVVKLAVRDESGSRIGGFIFRATHGGRTSSGQQTDRVGPAAIFAAAAGPLQVTVEHAGFVSETVEVDVVGGSVLPLDVVLRPDGD